MYCFFLKSSIKAIPLLCRTATFQIRDTAATLFPTGFSKYSTIKTRIDVLSLTTTKLAMTIDGTICERTKGDHG